MNDPFLGLGAVNCGSVGVSVTVGNCVIVSNETAHCTKTTVGTVVASKWATSGNVWGVLSSGCGSKSLVGYWTTPEKPGGLLAADIVLTSKCVETVTVVRGFWNSFGADISANYQSTQTFGTLAASAWAQVFVPPPPPPEA